MKICTVLRIGQVYYRSERTNICTMSFFTFKNIFRICFVIWYEFFSTYLVINNVSKRNLFFSHHKMVNVKYCKVQISNELSFFLFPKIIYYAYTGLLLVLLKEGQVYPVPPSPLPQPACHPLILLSVVRLDSYFPRFNVCFGCYQGLKWGWGGGEGECVLISGVLI